MVIVIQPGIRQALRLRFTQRAQRHTRLQTHRFYPLHHLFQVRHIAFVGILPRRAHTETRRSRRFRFARRLQHLFNFHQPLGFQPGFVARALRAIFAIFRTSSGLNRQQSADLHLTRIEMLTMHLLRFKQQIQQRFFK